MIENQPLARKKDQLLPSQLTLSKVLIILFVYIPNSDLFCFKGEVEELDKLFASTWLVKVSV